MDPIVTILAGASGHVASLHDLAHNEQDCLTVFFTGPKL